MPESSPLSPTLAADRADLVAHCGDLPLPRLVEVLRADQARCWRAGQRLPAEAYLAAFPALAASAEDALVLIWGEALLRFELGEAPRPEEYRDRFPQHADALALQFELQGQLTGGPDAPTMAAHPPPGPAEPARPEVPGYEILGELGRGGMGVVYRARQTSLNRLVALKMVLAGGYAGEQELARFRVEAEAVAHLQHPNIVHIYEVGEHQGLPYFSLEFCGGGSLEKKLGGTPQPPRPAAQLVETLARAVHAAHRQGVVHRDLKPANVLLTEDGTPKVTDFGLAKRLDVESGQTHSGMILGTPSYMAPEQAWGKSQVRAVGPAADVYALGAILYELLTGRPPFRGETPVDTIQQVMSDEPVPPSRLNAKVPRDLETICLKCLEKEPRKRYGSALELAGDLRRFRAREPIRARPAGPVRRLLKWARRRPAAAALWGVGLAVLLLGATGGLWWAQAQARRRADTAQAVGQALAEAGDRRGRARTGDLAAWREALAAVRHAEDLLAEGTGTPELERRVRELKADLQAGQRAARAAAAKADRDRRLVRRLATIRLEGNALRRDRGTSAPADAEYGRAFRDYGIAVDRLGVARAAARIRAQAIRAELVAALDDWAIARLVEGKVLKGKDWRARFRRLLAVARAADSDPWRRRLRAALAQRDRKTIRRLGGRARVDRLPVQSANLLAAALATARDLEGSLAVLRQAQLRYPGDFWINFDLAHALMLARPPRWGEAASCLRAALAVKPHAVVYKDLGAALGNLGDYGGSVAAARQALRLQPGDAEAYFNLGHAYLYLGDRRRAARALGEAVRLRPKSALFHNGLGIARAAQGDQTRAAAEFRRALRLQPGYAEAHCNLGISLAAQGDADGAARAFRAAVRHNRRYAEAHYQLGLLLARRPDKRPRAVAALRRAVRYGPQNAAAFFSLGKVLLDQGEVGAAVPALRRALRLQPDHLEARYHLGVALARQDRTAGAIEALNEVARRRPTHAPTHFWLGRLWFQRRDFDRAAAAYRRALRYQPNDARVRFSLGGALVVGGHPKEGLANLRRAIRDGFNSAGAYFNLGIYLYRMGNYAEALPAYREAVRRKSDWAEAHCNLGHTLRQLGRFAEAVTVLKRGHALGRQRRDWPYPSAQWVRESERLLALDRKLPAVRKGEAKPVDTAEGLELALLCQEYKALYATAAGLFAAAFRAKPELADDLRKEHRYKAACAAALAGSGRGKDAAGLDEQARARWRRQALAWLQADLAWWGREETTDTPQGRTAARQALRRWRQGSDLAGVRGAALERLPAKEQAAWRKLWAEVDALLQRVK
jgi:serine/threonine-protein kinase